MCPLLPSSHRMLYRAEIKQRDKKLAHRQLLLIKCNFFACLIMHKVYELIILIIKYDKQSLTLQKQQSRQNP